jgi:hypothetical protein
MDRTKIYPYVVPAGYVERQPTEPQGLTLSLGHDIYIMLVHDLDGVCRNVLAEELEKARLSPVQAHAQGSENLENLAKQPVFQTSLHRTKAQDLPFILWGGHWLAASCIRLPRLFELASKHLNTNDICVSIPQREVMLLFPKADRSFRDAMKAMIHENEREERKLITWELFSLTCDGVRPFKEAD